VHKVTLTKEWGNAEWYVPQFAGPDARRAQELLSRFIGRNNEELGQDWAECTDETTTGECPRRVVRARCTPHEEVEAFYSLVCEVQIGDHLTPPEEVGTSYRSFTLAACDGRMAEVEFFEDICTPAKCATRLAERIVASATPNDRILLAEAFARYEGSAEDLLSTSIIHPGGVMFLLGDRVRRTLETQPTRRFHNAVWMKLDVSDP
jgi:hypothetical protein